jgi:hypothetical protein
VGRCDKHIQLVLVGNGWRIAEFTAAPVAEQVGRAELEQAFQRFDIPSLAVYKGQLPVASKHLVALGVLKKARPSGRDELAADVLEARPPAGRDMRLLNTGQVIRWCDLVGPAVRNLPPGTGPGHIEIDRKTGPQLPASWLQRLNYAIPNLDSDPSDAYVRDNLRISDERLEKGPLQVILEKRAEALA